MTRNQLSTSVGTYSAGVMFTVDDDGNIEPEEKVKVLDVKVGGTIVTQRISKPGFSGRVCVRETEAGPCKCLEVVGVSDGNHMQVDKDYTVIWTGAVPAVFEIYSIGSKAPNTTNGKIRVGG